MDGCDPLPADTSPLEAVAQAVLLGEPMEVFEPEAGPTSGRRFDRKRFNRWCDDVGGDLESVGRGGTARSYCAFDAEARESGHPTPAGHYLMASGRGRVRFNDDDGRLVFQGDPDRIELYDEEVVFIDEAAPGRIDSETVGYIDILLPPHRTDTVV